MRSFESRFILNNPSLRQRLKRDIDLLFDSLKFLITWISKGRQIRKALRQAQEQDKTLFLEDYLGE